MTDSFSDDMVPLLVEQTGVPEGAVRAICAALTGPALRDTAMQWEICNTWGIGWEKLQHLLCLNVGDLQAIGRGAAATGLANMAMTQSMLARELGVGQNADLERARALSSISKQQSDLARAWIPQDPQQHQHLHAHLDIPAIAALMERKKEKPMAEQAREALRAQGREV